MSKKKKSDWEESLDQVEKEEEKRKSNVKIKKEESKMRRIAEFVVKEQNRLMKYLAFDKKNVRSYNINSKVNDENQCFQVTQIKDINVLQALLNTDVLEIIEENASNEYKELLDSTVVNSLK